MGTSHTTYLAFGIQIPDTDPEELREKLHGSGLGYLHAGDYDKGMTFLVTECHTVNLGTFRIIRPEVHPTEQVAEWTRMLRDGATRLGIINMRPPGWFVVPDFGEAS